MDRWWNNHRLVNGVFKGGGEKGIAYAGALQAVAAREVWFGSVAGASAGAITAALIAAGVEPREFETQTASGLEKVQASKLLGAAKAAAGVSKSLLPNDAL